MHYDHAHPRQAFGTRSTDVIFTQHFEHRRARHSHNHRQRNGAEHDGRQDHVHHRIVEVARLPPEEGIDQHKAGQRHGVIQEDGVADPPGNRRQVELYRDQHDQHDAPPEDRHGVAGQ